MEDTSVATIVRFICRELSPPVVVLIITFFAIGWLGQRNRGWNWLGIAWLINLIYLYLESPDKTIEISGKEFAHPYITSFSFFSNIAFFAYFWIATARPKPRFTCNVLFLGGVVFVGATYLSFRNVDPTVMPEVWMVRWHVLIFVNIFASIVSVLLAANALGNFLKFVGFKYCRLVELPMIVYAILQFSYLLIFTDYRDLMPLAFATALLCKCALSVGLILQFKENAASVAQMRIQQWQVVAFAKYAHELKHPTQVIYNHIQSIRHFYNSKKYGQIIDTIDLLETDWGVAIRLVDSFVLAAEPIRKKNLEYMSINTILDSAIQQVNNQNYQDLPTDIRKEYAGNLLVCGVATTLIQVFTNLLRNGIDAYVRLNMKMQNEHGGLGAVHKCKLALETHKETVGGNKLVYVSVRDEGIGISDEEGPHVFEPHFTTNKGINRGLGLWVVRSYVKSFGGGIDFVSPPENYKRGTVFTVVLPCANEARANGEKCVDFFGLHCDSKLIEEGEKAVWETQEDVSETCTRSR